MTEKSENILPDAKVFFDAITTAAAGLVYISETDAPIEPFLGTAAEKVTLEEFRAQVLSPPDTNVQEVDPAVLIAELTRLQPWYGDAKKATAARYAALFDLLQSGLTEIKEFRIGSRMIDIYVVGLTRDGRLAGIKTRAVET